MRLTVLIPTLNEARNLPDALASVRGWAEEILVVDSGSTDATVALAREAGARVLVHPFEGYAPQKNWALGQARGDWILALDADERVTPALRDEIVALFAQGDPPADAYEIGRDNYFFGLRARGGGVGYDRIVRLFRREARFVETRVHERLETRGLRVAGLKGAITHFSMDSIDVFLAKQHTYARLRVLEEQARGKRGASWFSMALRPSWRFLRMYVLQGGFLMGRLGLVMASVNAMGVFERYARLWADEIASGPREDV